MFKKVIIIMALVVVLALPAFADGDIQAEPMNEKPSQFVKLPGNGVIPDAVAQPKPEEKIVEDLKDAGKDIGIEKDAEKGK